jgi:hypothetical protein
MYLLRVSRGPVSRRVLAKVVRPAFASIRVVMDLLGHSTITQTMNTYSRVIPAPLPNTAVREEIHGDRESDLDSEASREGKLVRTGEPRDMSIGEAERPGGPPLAGEVFAGPYTAVAVEPEDFETSWRVNVQRLVPRP